jgi:hypothetical protein
MILRPMFIIPIAHVVLLCCISFNKEVSAFTLTPLLSTSHPLSTSLFAGFAEGDKADTISYNNNKRDMNSLTQWASDNAFQFSPSIKLANSGSNDESDYGVTFNKKKINSKNKTNKDESMTILSVPKSFVFDSREIYNQWTKKDNENQSQKTKQQLIQPSINYITQNGNFNQYTNHFILIIKLYEEYKKQSNSKWYNWIQSLPQHNNDFNTGVNMDDIEISCLPPFALALAHHEKEKLKEFYHAFQMIPDAFFDDNNDGVVSTHNNEDKDDITTNDNNNRKVNKNTNKKTIQFNDDANPFNAYNINIVDGSSVRRSSQTRKKKGIIVKKNRSNEKELFQWIFNIVHTRCWSYEDAIHPEDGNENDNENKSENNVEGGSRPIIVPLGDMFNHREPANVFVQDSSVSDVVEFVYSNHEENEFKSRTNNNSINNDNGLYLSYGLTNPHRFLVIFGFCDTTMPEIFSQLIFSNPSKEMINLGCNDRSEMVYRTDGGGGISNSIWDCIIYTLLNQVPNEQKIFYEAYLKKDRMTLAQFHQKYLLEAVLTLRPHVMNSVGEERELLGRIDGIVGEVRSNGQDPYKIHPRLMMIRQHNQFLCDVFDSVRQRLDGMAEAEVKRRREAQALN